MAKEFTFDIFADDSGVTKFLIFSEAGMKVAAWGKVEVQYAAADIVNKEADEENIVISSIHPQETQHTFLLIHPTIHTLCMDKR